MDGAKIEEIVRERTKMHPRALPTNAAAGKTLLSPFNHAYEMLQGNSKGVFVTIPSDLTAQAEALQQLDPELVKWLNELEERRAKSQEQFERYVQKKREEAAKAASTE